MEKVQTKPKPQNGKDIKMTTKESIESYGRPDADHLFDMTDIERECCFKTFLRLGNHDTRKGFMSTLRHGVFSRITGEPIEI